MRRIFITLAASAAFFVPAARAQRFVPPGGLPDSTPVWSGATSQTLSQIIAKAGSGVTQGDLTTALVPYLRSVDAAATYATPAQVTSAVATETTAREAAVTNLTDQIAQTYATQESLSGYVTTASLTQTLAGYARTSDLNAYVRTDGTSPTRYSQLECMATAQVKALAASDGAIACVNDLGSSGNSYSNIVVHVGGGWTQISWGSSL